MTAYKTILRPDEQLRTDSSVDVALRIDGYAAVPGYDFRVLAPHGASRGGVASRRNEARRVETPYAWRQQLFEDLPSGDYRIQVVKQQTGLTVDGIRVSWRGAAPEASYLGKLLRGVRALWRRF